MRFKSVLAAFIFLLLASIAALAIFVQTKSFGQLATKVISDISERKTQSKVSIQSLSISVFPPGLEINKVTLSKQINPIESIEAEFGKIGLYVSLIEIEERKLTLGEIRVEDSVVRYQSSKKDEEIKEIDKELIEKIFDISKSSPVGIDTLIVENLMLFVNHDLFEARRLKLFKRDDSFTTRFHLANIKPLAESEFKLDEMWGDAEIGRDDIKIYRLRVQHDVQSVIVKGKIHNYRMLKGSEAELNGEGHVYLKSLKHLITFHDSIDIYRGYAKVSFNSIYKKENLSSDLSLLLSDVRSNLFFADELRASLELNNNKLRLNTLDMSYKKQRLKLLSSATILDFKDNSYLGTSLNASVESFSINNVLRFLGPSLRILKGNVSGDVTFSYKQGNYYIKPKNDFKIDGLGLVVGEPKEPFEVIMIKTAKLNDSEISIINNEFRISTLIDLPNSKLEVEGKINKKSVEFYVPASKVNLEDLGGIANLDIKGDGTLGAKIYGPIDDVTIALKGKMKRFEILGYKLGQTDKEVTLGLKDSSIFINKFEALKGKTHISGTGHVNYDSADIALGINSNDAISRDLFQIISPVVKDVTFLPDDLDFSAKIDLNIFGKYRLPELKVAANIDFSDLTAYGESLKSGFLKVSLLNEVLSFNKLNTSKGSGKIKGDFSYSFKSKLMNANYQWENLLLSSFNRVRAINLSFDGAMTGSFAGSGSPGSNNYRLKNIVTETKTSNHTFEDSEIVIDILPESIKGSANIFGEFFTSDFNYYLTSDSTSTAKLKLQADNIKPYLVAVFGNHLDNEDFSGKTSLEIETSFKRGLENLYLSASLNELSLNHPEFKVNYVSTGPEFVVKKSVIESWNLNFREPDLYFVSKGSGVFGKNVSLVHEFHFNSTLLEILFSQVLSADGFLRNVLRIDGDKSNYDFSASATTSDLSLTLDQLPVPLNDIKYSLEFSGQRLTIQELSASLESGTVSFNGDVFFDGNDPDVNLKFQLDRAEIPILTKSSINVSGEGIILGNNQPYTASGEILVHKALIVNELNEFSTKSAALSQVRFLPANQESPFGKLLNINLNVKFENPARITNSLMDVGLRGEVRLTGSPARPRGEGRLFSPINSSRIFFKNSEYHILNADLNFNPKKEITNPDFDIQAVTTISSYKVYPKAYGDLERFNFDLTSDPALPRNSIHSLIAFGYSDEMQTTLTPEQQESLNQVGVGSFVFDRFKISDILNKQFGLQVNLGTFFEQSGMDSLLAGRSQDGMSGQGGIGRTRSATKIELKKRLNEALTLSVSSTMGGGIGQRQSMNLNYGLTNKVQVEGVYELRTNAEGEEDIIDNSIGADVKFRWTFK